METSSATLGMKVRLQVDFDTAVQMVTEALKAEGFGILTEIDVKTTLKDKIDVDFRPYKILGACNPHLAYRALSEEPEIGLLLPCNVTVSATDSDEIEIALIDPLIMMSIMSSVEVESVAQDAHARLARVIESLSN